MISWKGKSWSRGQKVKFLKGACAGCHKNNVFGTLEYFLLEGFDKDAGGKCTLGSLSPFMKTILSKAA